MENTDRPVVKLQLNVASLRALFPEGSEIEAKLAGGVIENFAVLFAARIEKRLSEEQGRVISETASELERSEKAWNYPRTYPALSDRAKEVLKGKAAAHLNQEIRDVIQQELTPGAVGDAARQLVMALVQDWVHRMNVRAMVAEEIRAAIREELAGLSLKDLLK